MTTTIHDLDDIDIIDVIGTIAERPQPVYLYTYDGDSNYLIVSDKEIDDEDIEAVANDLISDLDKDDEENDIYDDQA